MLKVKINSFSYKTGIPIDDSGNGGGFVFDCRAIHNPGRYPEYKDKHGKDSEVIDFFAKEDEMENFLKDVFSLVGKSVKRYVERDFSNLMISFGCTGGQHRSVFAAEATARYIKDTFNAEVELRHIERERNNQFI